MSNGMALSWSGGKDSALASEPLRDVGAVAFGDLFLEDTRAYREGRLATVAKQACFPTGTGHDISRVRWPFT